MFFDYFKFYFQAKDAHGIHSPFVFDFYNKVFKSKDQESYYAEIEAIRRELKNDNSEIKRLDLGAGKKVNSGKKDIISAIAKTSLKPKKWAQLLGRIISFYGYKNILDLGTSFGITTAYLAKAKPASNLITFEGCPETLKVAQKTFDKLEIKNVRTIEGNINETLPNALSELIKIDFAFFDANHKKNPTLDYFNRCLSKKHENSCFVFDDIYWSEEMKEAWNEIKSHPEVTITIDLFFIGLVFFRKGIIKQHFKLK